jgi:hypothetical protein
MNGFYNLAALIKNTLGLKTVTTTVFGTSLVGSYFQASLNTITKPVSLTA